LSAPAPRGAGRPLPPWGAELFAPLPLAAAALLALNDHWLKARFHDAVTGKLSDVAICFFLPLFVSALMGPLLRARPRARLALASLIAVAVFAAQELSPAAGRLFAAARTLVLAPVVSVHGAVFTRDLTDLFALALVPCAYLYGGRRLERAARRPTLARRAGASLALLAGTVLLTATTAPDLCDAYTAPLAFHVEGDCGPPGIIVVEADRDRGQLHVSGDRSIGGCEGNYFGGACPYQLSKGGWYVDAPFDTGGGAALPLPPRDAGADLATSPLEPVPGADAGGAGTGSDAGSAPGAGTLCAEVAPRPGYSTVMRRCTAALEGEELWVTCRRTDTNAALCRAKLTVVE
jgi:hypothetical protein